MKRRGKSASICDLIIDHKLDILLITESWLKGDSRDNRALADIYATLPDYAVYHKPRKFCRGGGICIILRKGFGITENHTQSFSSFELMDISVSSSGQQPLRLLSVYRPPSSKSKQTPSTFFREFAILLETISVVQCRLLFAGDFNFHVDNEQDRDASHMRDLLESAGLRQHVTGATHKKGHTLDLIISHETDSLVSNPSILYGLPSDHYAVKCDLAVARPKPTKCTVRQRRIERR